MCTLFVIFTIFLQATSLFIFNNLSCINFTPQYFVSLHSSKICFTSSSSKHNGHLPLSAFLLTPFSCQIPAISHAIPLLSFLEQHSVYNFLPQEKFNSLYSVNKLSSGNFANTFRRDISCPRRRLNRDLSGTSTKLIWHFLSRLFVLGY
jgi:hypothetical protein